MKKVSIQWRGLKQALYMVTAVAGLACTGCSDDVTAGTAEAERPLDITVMTGNVSRAPIHTQQFAEGSRIGVSLFTADGGLYRTGYDNILYTAVGSGETQTWSTANVPTLSSTPAQLVACYPWADGTDCTAMPVETDTQTDYMYSGTLAGLDIANNRADIVMQHALAAVRLSFVLEDYSDAPVVTAVGIKSDGLGTSATLDCAAGTLSDVQGAGNVIDCATDMAITQESADVELLAVPVASCTSGTTTVTAVIDGDGYSADIAFTEGYRQGYIYTYLLTVKDAGITVTSVVVKPWAAGTSATGKFEPSYQ